MMKDKLDKLAEDNLSDGFRFIFLDKNPALNEDLRKRAVSHYFYTADRDISQSVTAALGSERIQILDDEDYKGASERFDMAISLDLKVPSDLKLMVSNIVMIRSSLRSMNALYLKEKLDEYFDDNHGLHISVPSLCDYIGVSTKEWREYEKVDEIGMVVQWAKDRVKAYLNKRLCDPDMKNYTGLIFVAKNDTDMKDTKEENKNINVKRSVKRFKIKA